MDIMDLEREFGVGYKEKMNQAFIADFAPDEETRKLFDDVCFEINRCDLSNEEIVKILAVFPANIGITIARNINKKEDIIKGLLNLYFDEYIENSTNIKRGKSAFDKRLNWKKTDNMEIFLKERLITLNELDNIIRIEGVKSNEHVTKYQYAGVEYNGTNDRLKTLFAYRKIIAKTEYVRKTQDMINKIKHQLLTNVIKELKKVENIEV